MRQRGLWYVLIWLLLVALLQRYAKYMLFSPFLAWLIIPTVLVWSRRQAWAWLMLGAALAELISTLPPGIMALAILLPVGVRKLLRHIEVDVNLRFFGAILLTLALQVGVIMIHEVAYLAPRVSFAWNRILGEMPWVMLGITMLASGVFAFLSCAAWLQVQEPYRR